MVRIFDNKSTAVRWNFGEKFEKPRIILILICMCIACAFLCALSRYFLKSFRMYETTGKNTRGASWVSVEILHVEFIKQFSNFNFQTPTVFLFVTSQLKLFVYWVSFYSTLVSIYFDFLRYFLFISLSYISNLKLSQYWNIKSALCLLNDKCS